MTALSAIKSRRLLFRTYLVIVGGLILVAAAFDYLFTSLEAPAETEESRLAEAALSLIEAALVELPAEQWAAAAAALETDLGIPIRVLPADHVVLAAGTGALTQQVFDPEGRAVLLRRSAVIEAAIQLGPLERESADSSLMRLIPPFFYLSVFVLVSFWLWPLVRDVNLLSGAARHFAADYRRPMATAQRATTLRDLASSFDEMSARIRSLIQGQQELTNALSHEIRTPLTRIRFALACMGANESMREEIASIDEDVKEIDRLVGTMLDYARLDRPDIEIGWQTVPVDTWLEQASRKSRAPNGEIVIELEAEPKLARMDPHLMELALSNLLVNALRYAKHKVTVSFAQDADRNVLAVADDGPGIPAAEREAVFKPFTRLDNSRNRGTGGYGLGLAIVARIASRHGGRVRAEESPGGGARIVLSWPTKGAAPEPPNEGV